MNSREIHSVYFIGVGGIGMSALARYFHHIGKRVGGYDKTQTPITMELEDLGIDIHYDENTELIHQDFKDSSSTLIVYTPAVPGSHGELQYFKNGGYQIKKRSEVLGIITRDTFCFAVAGTHGKTTTSCILAHLLNEVAAPFTAFLGGISEDFNSNFVFEGNEQAVVEADEFDRSFLQLSPNIACITSMDADHLDIYGTGEELTKAFKEFKARLKENGKLLIRSGLPLKGITFGIEDGSDYCIYNVKVEQGRYLFDLKTPSITLEKVEFGKPGHHNLLNALAAFAMANESGLPALGLAQALKNFKGVQRRFSYQIKRDDFVFVDDYAHHPTEIEAVYQAISEMHPGHLVTVIFQPHLFSRTKDFADEFALALARFNSILLLDIYPAREEPIEGITSAWLLEKIKNPNKKLISKQQIVNEIVSSKPDVLITMGAGDIGLEVPRIKKELAYAS